MKRNYSYIITFLLGISLFGLLWIQFLWIDNAVDQASKEFDTNVNKVLAQVGKEVEDNNYCINYNSSHYLRAGKILTLESTDDTTAISDSIPFELKNPFNEGEILNYNYLRFGFPVQIDFRMKAKFIVGDLSEEEIEVDVDLLDSLLEEKLTDHGVMTAYQYRLVDNRTGESVHDSSGKTVKDKGASTYKQVLFEDDKYGNSFSLYVHFPDKDFEVWSSLWLVIIGSIVLLIVLTFLFIAFLRMIYNQRRLAEMRLDFLNTMTHEFKTPISNIGLALKALKSDMDEADRAQLLAIIDEEKGKLSDGIDLVLTTSLLDKKEFSLNPEVVDVHELIKKIISNSEFRIESHKADVKLQLNASDSSIEADEHYILHVLDNLLDNALKYSDSGVQITIQTRDARNGIEILFSDTGKGISASDTKHIFEKFYRVSTQNLYESKGFGIGLYYVKMILEAHGGSIVVESSLGKGTTFIIHLPKQQNGRTREIVGRRG